MLKPAQWKFLEEQAFTGYDNDANLCDFTPHAILRYHFYDAPRRASS
jgi:hypothetical protein